MNVHIFLEILRFLFFSGMLALNTVFFILNLKRYKIAQAVLNLASAFMVLPGYFEIFLRIVK